jgi:pimeloyl-ACP methyl ester carboxylesterase
MAEITHRTLYTNGINMHIAEAGSGPLVVMCHGFPESWYSWRHQLVALADAGYHAVAPDQRGYGRTDAPAEIDTYTQFHLVGDIIGLMDALGEERAVIAGHDWGAPVAWNTALLRPDRIRGVIGMSVPFGSRPSPSINPATVADAGLGGALKPTDAMKRTFGDNFFYILYFQMPGPAEHELRKDVRKSMRMLLYSASGDAPVRAPAPRPKTDGFLDQMVEPSVLPPWLTEADLDYFTAEFEHAGFRGGLNWYRNLDRTWALMGAFGGLKVTVPAMFVAGDRDGVIAMNPRFAEALKASVPNLKETVMLPGVGHWTQQERPAAVNEAMIRFIRSLD